MSWWQQKYQVQSVRVACTCWALGGSVCKAEPFPTRQLPSLCTHARRQDGGHPGRTATVTSAVLPVKSSPPHTKTIRSPNGRPKAPCERALFPVTDSAGQG